MATNGMTVNGYHKEDNGPKPMDNGPKTEDIYDGITEHLETMLCPECHEVKQLRILPCPQDHSFCEDCLDRAVILQKCPSCSNEFSIPAGGVSGMASDVTHEQIKDVLDSLCKLRSTNCPVCALDENQAKLASKVYKYCREEKELVCEKCVDQCERDLDLMDYNKVPDSTDRSPSAPVALVADTAEQDMEKKEVTQNGHHQPDEEPHKEKGQDLEDSKDDGHSKDTGQPVVVDGDNGDNGSSSSGEDEHDEVDARPISPPLSPSTMSPSISASNFHEPIHTPPPAYELGHCEAPALPAKEPLPDSDSSVTSQDLPILHELWCHMGSPLSRANDVIFLPNDDSIVVADWYAGQVHRFSHSGEPLASKEVKHSPWSLVRERSKGPWSIAYCHSDDKIYVSEIGMSSICRMSPKDLKVEKKRLKLEGVQNPAGLAFLRNNQLVLTEDTYRGPHRVAIYDLSGQMIKDWECSDPQLVCVDRYDRIVVSDHNNHRVEIYDTTGRLLTSFGDSKSLRHPMGVATDSNSNVFVTHETPEGYALSLWSSDGRLVGALHEWKHSNMTLTEQENWHMRSVDVHNDQLVLLGRRTLHGYKLKV